MWQLGVLADHSRCVCVKDIAQNHLLRQDQPSLGRGLVDWGDHHHKIARTKQVAHHEIFGFERPCKLAQAVFQFFHAVSRFGADVQRVFVGKRLFFALVAFVIGNKEGNFARFQFSTQEKILLPNAACGIHNQHRNVGGCQHFLCLLNAQQSQLSLVVKTGGVENDHRPQGEQLHGFFYGVGGGTLHIRYHRKILSRYRINKA